MVFTPSRESGSKDGFRDLLEANYQKRSLVHVSAGSNVPLLKNNVWLVVRGMVKLSAITIHGDDMLLGLAGPNEPFGDPLNGVEAYAATTLVDTDLLCLSCSEIRQDGALAVAMLEALGLRIHQSQALLALMGLKRVDERVRGFLELLASDYGQPCESGLRLNLRLTHQEVASALATTRVTVTRVIGALRDEGWLQLDGQRRLVVSYLPRR
ncbi:MAG: Crp/Fnr family transcriptional regulator [Aphanothece saxicola GSE-SYN-MK-01-06B]|jgi:CRP-like cAMP-binding protein|nr:Crp/Fnr family transcriptional regulator [Aphanothece saxicola GSE-SYN-MK-01-06B]